MTSFILRILFSGLMVFVPSEDGTEVTVLLLNVDHAYHTSDGAQLPHHNPIVVARAGACSGDCPDDDTAVAEALFPDKTSAQQLDSLAYAVGNGAAWFLDGSELSIDKGSTSDPSLPALDIVTGVRGTVNGLPQLVPTTSAEREDFSWIANIRQLCATGCSIDSDFLGANPPEGLIAARFRIRNGKVYTYSLARISSDVTPVNFKRLDGTGSASSYTQAVATWIGTDIEIEGSSIEIVEEKFDNSTGRAMTLTPDSSGKVEVAVLNLPSFVPPVSPDNEAPQVGTHFEMYYSLSQTPAAVETRLVPRPGVAGSATYPVVEWDDVHPQSAVTSELLNRIRLDIGRSAYDRTLCPPGQNPLP